MRLRRQLSSIGRTTFLTSLICLGGCQANLGVMDDDGDSGSSPDSGTGPDGKEDPRVCIPGIRPTTQIRRLLNREYDNVVEDLLGVTTLASAANNPPSSLLVPDYEGSLTDIAWNSYLVAARGIAAEVMSGSAQSRFLACDPAASGCLSETIRAFGRKAFRRPLTDAEVTRFEQFLSLTPQGTPTEIAEAILYAFLASPSFLTLPELAQEREGEAIKLSQHEIAARLSFLLWGSVPDEALSVAADTDQLLTREQILEQAQRMVKARDKSGPIVTAFHRFYADIRQGSHWATLDHDPEKYPNYSPEAQAPMMAEIDAFFEEVAFGGGSFKDLFLSNVGFVNQATAPLYGLDAANFGPALTRVELDPSQRPGFLTRVGFLSSYSTYATTSPILRGAFISERIVGVEIKAPPPGATDTPMPDGDYKTYREVVEALTSPSACVSCHARFINPPGFVMERYDSVGSWQTTDLLGGAIDGEADVYFSADNIKKIETPLELMTELGTDPQIQRRYAELWVSFATGRAPNSNDACIVDQLGDELSQDGYSVLNLLTELTRADSFRLRTVGD